MVRSPWVQVRNPEKPELLAGNRGPLGPLVGTGQCLARGSGGQASALWHILRPKMLFPETKSYYIRQVEF